MYNLLKMAFWGVLFILLGAFALAAPWLLPKEANLPFWPFDGVLAILGGVFIIWWSCYEIRELSRDKRELDCYEFDGVDKDDRNS